MAIERWDRLLTNRCPKHGTKLVKEGEGMSCRWKDDYYREKCDFFITHERAKELKIQMRQSKKKRS